MKRSLALVLSATAACGLSVALVQGTAAAQPSGHAAGVHATAPSPANPRIVIQNFGFHGTMTVRPGVTVRVVNKDTVTHTLTMKGPKAKRLFDTGPISPGAKATFTAPKTVGSYPFHCMIHTDMTGTLVVKKG